MRTTVRENRDLEVVFLLDESQNPKEGIDGRENRERLIWTGFPLYFQTTEQGTLET